MFLSESNYLSWNTTLSSSLKRALIFKTPSEALLSVLICTIARSSFLAWLKSQILNTLHLFSLVLQNICLLAYAPGFFHCSLCRITHYNHPSLSNTWRSLWKCSFLFVFSLALLWFVLFMEADFLLGDTAAPCP